MNKAPGIAAIPDAHRNFGIRLQTSTNARAPLSTVPDADMT